MELKYTGDKVPARSFEVLSPQPAVPSCCASDLLLVYRRPRMSHRGYLKQAAKPPSLA